MSRFKPRDWSNIRPGTTCRVLNHHSIGEVRGATVRVRKQRKQWLDVTVMSGPAKGSTHTVHVDDISSCSHGRRG